MQVRGYSIKRVSVTMVGLMLLLSVAAVAQEMRSEISVQGTGVFTKNSNGNHIRYNATDTGGVLFGYRYNINRWLAAEADYGYARNTSSYQGTLPARIQADVHQVTSSAVVKLPVHFLNISPYVLGGGGALMFDPTGNAGGTFRGATQETRGAFLWGGGADYDVTKHLALRAEYRGYVYKVPTFNLASLKTDTWNLTSQVSAGIVFRFQDKHSGN